MKKAKSQKLKKLLLRLKKGKLPDICSSCKEEDLDYGDFDYDDTTKILSQTVCCNSCDQTYYEYFTIIGWEKA